MTERIEYNHGDCENEIEDLKLDLELAESLIKRLAHKGYEECDADLCKDIVTYFKGG